MSKNLAEKVKEVEKNLNLRITEEQTLPEYLIAELLRLRVELRDAEVKIMVLEPRLQVSMETESVWIRQENRLRDHIDSLTKEAEILRNSLRKSEAATLRWRVKAKGLK